MSLNTYYGMRWCIDALWGGICDQSMGSVPTHYCVYQLFCSGNTSLKRQNNGWRLDMLTTETTKLAGRSFTFTDKWIWSQNSVDGYGALIELLNPELVTHKYSTLRRHTLSYVPITNNNIMNGSQGTLRRELKWEISWAKICLIYCQLMHYIQDTYKEYDSL